MKPKRPFIKVDKKASVWWIPPKLSELFFTNEAATRLTPAARSFCTGDEILAIKEGKRIRAMHDLNTICIVWSSGEYGASPELSNYRKRVYERDLHTVSNAAGIMLEAVKLIENRPSSWCFEESIEFDIHRDLPKLKDLCDRLHRIAEYRINKAESKKPARGGAHREGSGVQSLIVELMKWVTLYYKAGQTKSEETYADIIEKVFKFIGATILGKKTAIPKRATIERVIRKKFESVRKNPAIFQETDTEQ